MNYNVWPCVDLVVLCIRDAGHLCNMLEKEKVQAWGVAPNKSSAQPEMLGMGCVKVLFSGFLNVTLVNMQAAVAAFETNEALRNGIGAGKDGFSKKEHFVPSLQHVQDMLKAFSIEQANEFTEIMGQGQMYKWTMGSGDCLVIPPGHLCFPLHKHSMDVK